MRITDLRIIAVTIVLLVVSASAAWAQLARSDSGTWSSQQDRYEPQQTISPYLNLVTGQFTSDGIPTDVGTYHTLVRPQLQQREWARRQREQMAQLRTQLHRLERQTPSGTERVATGHTPRFMSYSHYYPQLEER